jgi:hypothetical protein
MIFSWLREPRCKVHGRPLLEGEVRVRYGLIRLPEVYLEARKKLFPNSNSFKLGGCYVSENNPKTTLTLFCAACRQAEEEWETKNRT